MTVIRGLDSSTPPTAAQVAEAKAAGYGAWLGYLGKAGDNLLHPWAQADFQTVLAGGLLTGAFCSGQDDPAWVRQTAAAWGLHVVILDDEAGIRADGAWVPGWLAAAGAGLYGNGPIMREYVTNPAVPFFVLSAYPETGTQTATWSTAEAGCSTGKPTGWQWAGTVPMFGTTVDLANYNPAIFATAALEDEPMTFVVTVPEVGIFLLNGGLYVNIPDDTDVAAWEAVSGVKTVTVSQAQHEKLVASQSPGAAPAFKGDVTGTLTIS